MSWGSVLWDSEKGIFDNIDNGLKLLHKTRQFMQARAALEQSYAKDLAHLVKTHKSEIETPDCGDEFSSLLQAWRLTLEESDNIAKQHEGIAEGINTQCVEPMKNLLTEQRNQRKNFEKELQKKQRTLASARSKFDTARKNYEKAAKDVADARSKLEKAQTAKNPDKSKMDKAKNDMDKAINDCDKMKSEFIIATDEFNRVQREYYNTDQLQLFNSLQSMTEDRIRQHGQFIVLYSRSEREVLPVVTRCLDAVDLKAQAVDAAADTNLFAERNKTGLSIPSDRTIDDSSSVQATTSYSVQKVHERRVKKSKLFKTTARKKTAIRDDFGHLPPEQRKNAIRKKVADLQGEHAKVLKGMAAMSKTVELYRSKPEFGDDKTIAKAEREHAEMEKELEKLANELFKFQLYLSAIEGTEMPPPPEGYKGEEGGAVPYDYDTQSMASYNSGYGTAPQQPDASYGTTGASAQESAYGTTNAAIAEDDDDDSFDDDFSDDDDFDDGHSQAQVAATSGGAAPAAAHAPAPEVAAGPVAAIAHARMLYEFAGSNDNELAAPEGAVVEVLLDDGSGWVHARRDGVEGYVPKSYLQM